MEAIAPVTTRVRPLMWMLGVIALLGAVLTALVLSRGGIAMSASRALGGAATMFLAGTFGFVYLWLWQTNARLLVGEGMFGAQDAFKRRHTWTASEVGAVIDVAVAYSKTAVPQRGIFVIALDGRRLMALNPIAWDSSAIDRVVRATGKSLQVRGEPVSALAFRQEFPKAMPWVSAHSSLTGGLLAIGLIVVALGTVIVLTRSGI